MRRHYDAPKPAGDIAYDDTLATHGYIATLEGIKGTRTHGLAPGSTRGFTDGWNTQCAKILLRAGAL
jgi:hypothetical protein